MDILHDYARELEKVWFMQNKKHPFSSFFCGVRMEMDTGVGQGYWDLLRVRNGLYASGGKYCIKQDITSNHGNMPPVVSFGLMLSGRVGVRVNGQRQDVAPGTVWCTGGSFESLKFKQFAGEDICSLQIALPEEFVASWLGSACCQGSQRLEKLIARQIRTGQFGYTLLGKGLGRSSACMQIADRLIAAKRETLVDSLRFESLALEFLSHVLTLDEPAPSSVCHLEHSRQTRGAIDEAIDILRHEWTDPPGISALARRVRLNECYLKKGFRWQTGMTIGAYVRQLRMAKAKELIESGGYSVLDAAVFVGYSNPGHFSMAFKKIYGHSPSYYAPRFTLSQVGT